MVMSVSSYAGEKDSTSVSKPSIQSARKAKYQLRKEPMTVSDDEAPRVFKLGKDEIEIDGKKFPIWRRPLEYIQNNFRDNRDGTIIDHATLLMWQKSGSDSYMKYDDVKVYINKLNREKFAGYNDWRLPTVDELISLATKEKQSNDLYISPIFEKKEYNWFWSSDKRPSGKPWIVVFYHGLLNWDYLGTCFYVRAVRSLQ